MNDREASKQERRLRRATAKWKKQLWLSSWDILNKYYRGQISGHGDAAGVADVQWEYMQATISWNLVEVAKMNAVELERSVCHEFLHLVVRECREARIESGIHHEERVVSHLVRILCPEWASEGTS